MNETGVCGESNAMMAGQFAMHKVPEGLECKRVTNVAVREPSGVGQRCRILKANFKFHVRYVI